MNFRGRKFRLFKVVHGMPSQDVRPGSSVLKMQLHDFGPCY
jgi:hypothetical protein